MYMPGQKELYFSCMKLRIQGNTIRLRLSRSEVDTFRKKGYIEEVTDFGARRFTYALNRLRDGIEMTADFADELMTVHVPEDQAEAWYDTDSVGMENTVDLDGFRSLYILVEKDFKCIGKEGDDDRADNYPNPKSTC
jgi:hypothetical protein